MIPSYDIPNPFTNCKVVSVGGDPRNYTADFFDRGDVNFPVSRSMLMSFSSCPSKWFAGWKSKDTDSTEWGTLIDCMVLTPENLQPLFSIQPKTYPAPKTCTAVKNGTCIEGDPIPWDNKSNHCKVWAQLQGGKQIVSDKDLTEAGLAARKLLSDDRIFDVLNTAKKQVLVTGEYHDKDTGLVIPAKCLIDIVPDKSHAKYGRSLADLKTARSAHPGTWLKSVHTYGYDAQAAMCLWLYEAATGEERNTFLHVIQENTHPYQIARRMLSLEFVQLGQTKIVNALRRYCRCLKTGIWPNWDDNSQFDGWGIVEPAAYMAAIEDAPEPVEETEEKEESQISDGLN